MHLRSTTIFFLLGIITGEGFLYYPVFVILIIAGTFLVSIYRIRRQEGIGLWNYPVWIAATLTFLIGFVFIQWREAVPSDDISRYVTGSKVWVTGRIDGPPRIFDTKTVISMTVRYLEVRSGPESEVQSDLGGRSAAQPGSHLDTAVDIRNLNAMKGHRVSGRLRLTLYDSPERLVYGDILRVYGRLRTIRSFQNPGGFDYARYLAWQGIRVSASVSPADPLFRVGNDGKALLKGIYVWRERIRVAMKNSLSRDASAILQAMVIGTTEDLTPEIRDIFMMAGVTHLLSISGSHLGMLALLVFTVTKRFLTYLPYVTLLGLSRIARPSQWAALMTVPIVTFYAFLAGGEVATVRALIMVLFSVTALVLDRDRDMLHALSFAALGTLIQDPRALFHISFQLSYLSVAVMGQVMRKEIQNTADEVSERTPGPDFFHAVIPDKAASGVRGRLMTKVVSFGVLSWTIFLWTSPLVAFYFNQVSWVGLFSNGLMVPLVGCVVVPVGLFSAVFSLGFSSENPAGGLIAAGLNEWVVGWVLRLTRYFSRIPGAEVHLAAPSLSGLAVIYGVLLLSQLAYLRRRMAGYFGFGGLALLLLLLFGRYPHNSETSIQATFLDVGQGDAAVYQLGKQVLLVDGGGSFSRNFDLGQSVVAPYLWNQGIHKIDLMVVTHPQLDHIEGLFYILAHFQVQEVWVNSDMTHTSLGKAFLRRADRRHVRVREVSRDIPIRGMGPCGIRILNPSPSQEENISTKKRRLNDHSVVMKIQCGKESFLMTGDIEQGGIREILQTGVSLESSILKVPHHGSRGSLDEVFIHNICPQVAVISVGPHNPYRHPNRQVVTAYEAVQGHVIRTDESGAIRVTVDPTGRRLQTASRMRKMPFSWGTLVGK